MNKSFNVRVHNIFTYMLQILFQYVFHFYGSQMNYVDVSEWKLTEFYTTKEVHIELAFEINLHIYNNFEIYL
jgi:hypothetical protein